MKNYNYQYQKILFHSYNINTSFVTNKNPQKKVLRTIDEKTYETA